MSKYARFNSPTPKPHCWSRFLRCQQGVGLAETLVATAIMSLAMVALLSAFSTGALALRRANVNITAENLARNQMEYTKSLPYLDAPASYSVITPVPAGYSLSAQASPISGRDAGIQKITVIVQRNGSTAFTLEGYKLDQ